LLYQPSKIDMSQYPSSEHITDVGLLSNAHALTIAKLIGCNMALKSDLDLLAFLEVWIWSSLSMKGIEAHMTIYNRACYVTTPKRDSFQRMLCKTRSSIRLNNNRSALRRLHHSLPSKRLKPKWEPAPSLPASQPSSTQHQPPPHPLKARGQNETNQETTKRSQPKNAREKMRSQRKTS